MPEVLQVHHSSRREESMTEYVTLALRSYNRLPILRASLESLWANTDYPYELIVHDDGSRGDAVEYLQEMQAQGKIQVLILNREGYNIGMGLATDRAVRCGTGDYIVELDGDEQFSPSWLTRAVLAMKYFPEIGILHLTQRCVTHDRDKPTEYITYDEWDRYVLHEEERNGIKIAVVWMADGGGFSFTRETFERAKGWYLGYRLGGDEDMFFRFRVCPMARYLAGYIKELPPPESNAEHWEKYKDTPWMALLDPPPISPHWGEARTERGESFKTLVKQPPTQGRPYDETFHEEMIAAAIEAGKKSRGHYFGPCPYKFIHPQEKKP
jgi:glycosyltransferase involved in cell wall biosynthesis